jgi:tRNA pseudouridine13 synthase
LRPGHLHGNRFRILIREPNPDAATLLGPIIERLRAHGLPNFYGPQRFGRAGETALLGLALLRGEPPPVSTSGRKPNLRSPFLRKLALSAAQSALFNHYLGRRLLDGLLQTVLAGDVMARWPFGGMFVATDVPAEQDRFAARETVHTGPIFGRKTFSAAADAAAREEAILADAQLAREALRGFGKLLQGTRRHNLVYLQDLTASGDADGIRLQVTLPAGTYATVLLREITKSEADSVADEGTE